MPELPQDSTQAPPPPPLFPWEDHPAFRFTFLQHFTQPGDREALEHIGKMLYDSALELAGKWPTGPESSTRGELRAVLADLRHAESFIATVANSRNVSSLGPEDERLSLTADELSRMVGRTCRVIESIIGPLWKGGVRS
jgi:hypothetical protein